MTIIMKSFILRRSNLLPRSSFLVPRYSFRKRENCPGVDAEGDDKHGLDGMYDQHEPESLLVGHTVEDEHGLDGEMPGPSTVRCRYDDGKVGHDEGDQCTADAQMRREVEAEERQVIVQEIAHPDTDGEKEIERQVLDTSQG